MYMYTQTDYYKQTMRIILGYYIINMNYDIICAYLIINELKPRRFEGSVVDVHVHA